LRWRRGCRRGREGRSFLKNLGCSSFPGLDSCDACFEGQRAHHIASLPGIRARPPSCGVATAPATFSGGRGLLARPASSTSTLGSPATRLSLVLPTPGAPAQADTDTERARRRVGRRGPASGNRLNIVEREGRGGRGGRGSRRVARHRPRASVVSLAGTAVERTGETMRKSSCCLRTLFTSTRLGLNVLTLWSNPARGLFGQTWPCIEQTSMVACQGPGHGAGDTGLTGETRCYERRGASLDGEHADSAAKQGTCPALWSSLVGAAVVGVGASVVGETQRHDRRYPRGFSAPLAASVRVPHARRGGGGGGGDTLVGAGLGTDTRGKVHKGPDGLVV
jgi:hypothetical protein